MEDLSVNFSRSIELIRKCHSIIPGGCHTYSKGDDQFPEAAPSFIVRGKGCHVWDVDGNEFIEYGMGLRAVTLGHAYPPVVEAARKQILLGSNFTRPSLIEYELAETVVELFEGAEMVKFAKNGSDVTTAAVKLSRAATGRDLVAICADHPFFSTDDWFIGTTELSAGIPMAIRDLTLTFRYNDADSVSSLFKEHPGRIACVILEPATSEEPAGDYLHAVQRLCRENGAVFILDEMITGFRWNIGGAQKHYGVVPDLSAFGKGMANGFSVSALVGKKELMELGGIHHNRERVFLLSTTHGAETHALAAAAETIRVYRQEDVVGCLHVLGERLRSGIGKAIREIGIGDYFQVIGRSCNLVYVTKDPDGNRSQPFRTLFLQELIRRGIIAPSFVVSFSHADSDIDRTIEAVSGALRVYRSALEEGIGKYLKGRPVKPVNRRFN
ncbi:glutamate-1-semialdehyde 2,1-aminomutase [bacterium]|nr:glutamate-1-semialdehyde 2,1-aminomutase [bacterium]